jgi:nitroreductase
MALAALTRRRTCRQYDAGYTIPQDVLEQIANAALQSPTGMNTQDVDLLVVSNRAKLDEASTAAYNSWPQSLKDGFKNGWPSRPVSPGLKNIVTCDAPAVIFLLKNERASDQFLQIDVGIVTQSIIVAAQEFGLESMCMGIWLAGDVGNVEQILRVPKGSLVMGVAIGKAKEGAKLPDKKIIAKATFIE